MRKALILFIVLLMALGAPVVHAEASADALPPVGDEAPADEIAEAAEVETDAEEEEAPTEIEFPYDELTVGSVTPFTGCFFTGMWGNASSDLDMRMLLHGYNLVDWHTDLGAFQIDPSVVSGIQIVENGRGDRIYTLTLYGDLMYSDGTKITARDYAFSFLLSMAPQIAEIGGAARPLEFIKGYADYVGGRVPYLSGLHLLNENTLSVTIDKAYLPFFYEMGWLDCVPYPIQVIAPGCVLKDDGKGAYIANEDSKVKEPLFTADLLRETILDAETGYLSNPKVSSGPYKLVSYDGKQAELEINEYYKGDSNGLLPIIPRLVFKTVENETMVDQLAAGEVGLLNKCSYVEEVQRAAGLVEQSDSLTMSHYLRNGMSFVSFCCENEPVDDVAVREAISLCMDKDQLTTDTVGDYGLRVDGYYGMGQWMFQLASGMRAYDVEAPAEDADQQTIDAYNETVAAWEAVNMDDIRVYEQDLESAVHLLDSVGWNLNREGEPFDPEKDDVRCKDVDGELKALELKMICPEGSSLNQYLDASFIEPMASIGIRVEVETLPMADLQQLYYRHEARDCHMIMLATNFDIVFDPSITFMPDGEAVNHYNPTAIADEELYRLALDMRHTASDDVLGYCRKWVDFQRRFQEVVPVISIYSNVYTDFYPAALHGYDIASNITWSQAVIGAYLGDVSEQAPAGDEAIEGEPAEADATATEVKPEEDIEAIFERAHEAYARRSGSVVSY